MEFSLDFDEFERLIPGRVDLAHPVIDLRNCTWIAPDGALSVFLLMRYFLARGKRPTVYRPTDSNVDSYFERTGVYVRTKDQVDYVPPVDDVICNVWHPSSTMKEITPVTSESDVGEIIAKFRGAAEGFHDRIMIRKASSALLEMVQNIPHHANPNNPAEVEGYVSIQIYKDGKKITIAVGDLGIGIRESLSSNDLYAGSSFTDLQAVKKAIIDRASRLKRENELRGGGLRRMKDHIASLNGIVIVRSGTCGITFYPDGRTFEREHLNYFPGTQLAFTVKSTS